MMGQIQISQHVYDKVREYAARNNQTPDRFVEDLLIARLLPPHPYVEVIQGREQPRAVIKGTRIGVDVIVGYTQAGYTPQEIAAEILPYLNLAQIYDALGYYDLIFARIEAVSIHMGRVDANRGRYYSPFAYKIGRISV